VKRSENSKQGKGRSKIVAHLALKACSCT